MKLNQQIKKFINQDTINSREISITDANDSLKPNFNRA